MFYILIFFALSLLKVSAKLIWTNTQVNTLKVAEKTSFSSAWFFNIISSIFLSIIYIIIIIIWIIIIIKIIRLLFELYYSKNLIYLKITLPRNDSKLDKEHETKKDFKEKIWIMSMFFKSIHKISDVWFKESIVNYIFKHAKLSLELVYEKWEVSFFIVTYSNFLNLVSQHITSIYTDAEIKIVDKDKEYVNLREKWYNIKSVSLQKQNDDVFPIKSYKYLENDPINNFTNVFWWLWKEDKAVFQIVIKPIWSKWNNKAKKAAGLVSKWQYNKKKKFAFADFLWNPIVAIIQWPEDMVKDINNAPWASSWDAYKIFNQAETESQKIMWEAASQPAFNSSIRIIVSSNSKNMILDSVNAIIWASSIFTDEYNNSLDNPQVREDWLSFIFTPAIYFWFKYKLVWFFQNISTFSVDEISTMYHFPDINYNKSPLIKWLDYKKLAPPHNLRMPIESTLLEEKDAFWWKKLLQKTLWWFPVFKDAVLMWWNEYRNKKTPIYFSKKDRGRHHYIIWKSWGW